MLWWVTRSLCTQMTSCLSIVRYPLFCVGQGLPVPSPTGKVYIRSVASCKTKGPVRARNLLTKICFPRTGISVLYCCIVYRAEFNSVMPKERTLSGIEYILALKAAFLSSKTALLLYSTVQHNAALNKTGKVCFRCSITHRNQPASTLFHNYGGNPTRLR